MKRAASLLLVGLVACSAAPPPPPAVKPVAPPAPAVAPPMAARWLESDGSAFVVGEVEGGTLLVLGGRRVLVSKSGAVTRETAPSPEPINEIIAVPAKGGIKLVARTDHAVLRLDDPLGAPVPLLQTKRTILSMGSAPGAVAIWTGDSDLPRVFDVETGAASAFKLPTLPVRSIAFVDAQRGAVALEVGGGAVTGDGGATWSSLYEAPSVNGIRVDMVRVEHGVLAVRVGSEWDPVDVAKHKLGRPEETSTSTTAAPLVDWVKKTGHDPLVSAAESGLAISSDEALIAEHALVARVDLKTGLVTELVETAKEPMVDSCTISRASANAAWVACGLDLDTNGETVFPWGVSRVEFGGPKLKIEKPAVRSTTVPEARGTSSGGFVFFAPCNDVDDANACVRQPDGSWASVKLESDSSSNGINALADGRVVFPRPTVPQDDGDSEERTKNGMRVVGLDAKGKQETLLRLPIAADQIDGVVFAGQIEEDADKTIHVVYTLNEEAVFCSAKPGGEVKINRLPKATSAAYRGGKAVAVAEGALMTSLDDGATWAPTSTRETLEYELGRIYFVDNGGGMLSELGLRAGAEVRIGWGAEGNAASTEKPSLGGVLVPELVRAPLPSAKQEKTLQCKSEGAGQGTPPFSSYDGVKVGFTTNKPAVKGARHYETTGSGTNSGTLATLAVLAEDGKDDKDALPAKWTLKWINPTAIGERIHSVTFAAPPNTARDSRIRNVVSDGPRALFTIASGKRTVIVRVKGNNQTEVIDEPASIAPGYEPVVFGVDKGEPIAWFRDTAIVVWNAGEAPRVIGRMSTHASRFLGQPTKEGVPVIASSTDWAMLRVFPLAPESNAVALEGWKAAPNLSRIAGTLDACTAATAKGSRFLLKRNVGSVNLDGTPQTANQGYVDLRVNGSEACVAAETLSLAVPYVAPPPATKGPPKPKELKGPVMFLRTDLVGKHAEGGDTGAPPKGNLRRMSCAIAAPLTK